MGYGPDPAQARAAWAESLYQPRPSEAPSVRDVARRLHRNRILGVVACLTVWALAGAFVVLVPQKFAATTTLLVDTARMEATSAQYASADDVVSAFGQPKVANQAAILRTVPAIADTSAKRLIAAAAIGLPTTDLESLSEWIREEAVKVNAETGKDEADLILVEARAPTPELSAAISGIYAESYMQLMRDAVSRQRSAALETQRARVVEVVDELSGLDQQLAEFWRENGTVSIEQDAQQAGQRISDLQTALDDARIAYSTHSATLEGLESELGELDLAQLAEAVASSAETEIATVTQHLTNTELELEQFYKKNPGLRADPSRSSEVMGLLREAESLRARLDRLGDQYVQQMVATGGVDLSASGEGRSYILNLRRRIAEERVAQRAAEARVSTIQSRIAAIRVSQSRYSTQSVSLTQIQRNRELADQRLKDEIDRLGALQADEPSEFIKRIQAAVIPTTPAFPNVKLILLAGFMLGILLGGGVAYGWSALDSTVHGPEDVASLGTPVRGQLPNLDSAARKVAGKARYVEQGGRRVSSKLVVMHAPQAAESALVRKYALGLAARTPRGGTMLFTSPDTGAGKSTLSANVASALSLAGYRTLIIDADIFRPGQAETLGLTSRSGLDVETGAFGPGGGVEQFGGMMQLLFGLTLRARIPADAEALAAHAAVHLAGFYGQHFDYVLIDTPPTSASSIAAGIGRFAHTRILVVGAGRTERDLVAMSLAELHAMDAPATEIAINRMDMSEPTAMRTAYQQAQAYYGGAGRS